MYQKSVIYLVHFSRNKMDQKFDFQTFELYIFLISLHFMIIKESKNNTIFKIKFEFTYNIKIQHKKHGEKPVFYLKKIDLKFLHYYVVSAKLPCIVRDSNPGRPRGR